jgi:hypothetical protein
MATGAGVAPAPATNEALAQKLRALQLVGAAASWFLWIAGLSLVNSAIGLGGGKVHFIVGLGITQFVDAVAHQVGSAGVVLDLVINGIVAGVFAMFWHFGRKGQRWPFLTGMVLYAADGLLLLLFQDYFSVAFHCYALFRIYNGLKVLPVLNKFEAAAQLAGAPIVPR